MRKPAALFDRDWEWRALGAFVGDPRPGATLGVVSGRRRQGKSMLLDALARASGGFYYEAIDGSEADILRDLGAKLAVYSGAPGALSFGSIEEALQALLGLGAGRGRPRVVVFDEFPALAGANPAAVSVVRNLLGSAARSGARNATRLLLCGSALAFMGGLLGGQSPLRGRAGLELIVRAFDYRTARKFWGLDDLNLAVRVFSIVGGTPAYRREFVAEDVPRGRRDFDAWVARAVLNPARPLFREARYLLAEDPAIGSLGLYHSVLGAISSGETTSARIAGRLGRPATALAHPLTVLADAGFVSRDQDAFHEKRVHYAIAEPLIAFHHAILRPAWSELERPGHAHEVWTRVQPQFLANVVGPAFETMCRAWARDFAAEGTFGGVARTVRRGLVPDAEQRQTHEVDVVVLGEKDRVLAVGEAKWGEVMGPRDVSRLRRVLTLLEARGYETRDTLVACFSGKGFSAELKRSAAAERVVLVDLERLYGGS
jgi:uncharacterized protein